MYTYKQQSQPFPVTLFIKDNYVISKPWKLYQCTSNTNFYSFTESGLDIVRKQVEKEMMHLGLGFPCWSQKIINMEARLRVDIIMQG